MHRRDVGRPGADDHLRVAAQRLEVGRVARLRTLGLGRQPDVPPRPEHLDQGRLDPHDVAVVGHDEHGAAVTLDRGPGGLGEQHRPVAPGGHRRTPSSDAVGAPPEVRCDRNASPAAYGSQARGVFGKAGVSIPRTASAQQSAATPVSDPKPGDLVFFGSPAWHVGIYTGNGMMVDSPREGKSTSERPIFSGVSGYGRF